MNKLKKFIMDMFDNYLIRKTYNEELKKFNNEERQQLELDVLFGNIQGIDL